ncbi:hypothetical protein UlMin_004723 [Ulmus minor]
MVVCYHQKLGQTKGLWRAENATNSALLAFILNLVMIITITRLLILVFRFFYLPRITAEILGGILLGPGFLGRTFLSGIYIPFRHTMTLETIGNLSLLYYMFLVGLEVDIEPVLRARKKTFSIAIAGFILPFPIGYALHYLFIKNFDQVSQHSPTKHGPLFWGITLATTNFPDLAQILIDLKLLHTDVGRTALSSAIITDAYSWGFLVFSMAIVNESEIMTMLFGVIFIALYLAVLRPTISWIVSQWGKDDEFEQHHLVFALAGVLLSGYISDACGSHSILGGFMLGVIMPKGKLKSMLMEKVQVFVSGLLMPIYFLIVGLRTNHFFVFGGAFEMRRIIGVLAITFAAKFVSTFLAAVFLNKMKIRDGMALGLLMNTKGLLSLITLGTGRDLKALNNPTFTIMIFSLWLMTAAVGPILALTYRSTKCPNKSMRRTLTSLEANSEVKILTCVHSIRDVTGIINLLDASSPSKHLPLGVFSMHLVEHIGRATAMLIVHDSYKANSSNVKNKDSKELEASQITQAFKSFKNGKEGVSLQSLTVVSSYTTMHEDICSLAAEKDASLIILPLHLKPAIEGVKEISHIDRFRGINERVMKNSSCSVAILVDRGHRPHSLLKKMNSCGELRNHFIMLFIGGPDDREALTFVARISKNPKVSLTVIRFRSANIDNAGGKMEEEKQREMDEKCVNEFKHKTKNNSNVNLTEVEVSNVDGIVKVIGEFESDEFDLIIVGRGRQDSSLIMPVSSDWSEYPELGPLGDNLVCSNIAANAWILIVQQGQIVLGSDHQQLNGDDLPSQIRPVTLWPHDVVNTAPTRSIAALCIST